LWQGCWAHGICLAAIGKIALLSGFAVCFPTR
jgi:hypothetical protein